MAIEPRNQTTVDGEQLQRLLDEAAPHQTVELPPGRITGTFTIDRPLILRGAGAEQTIVEGDGTGPVLAVDAEEGTVRIDNMSISQGRSSFGGGVSIDNGARVEIHRCLFTQNRAPSGCGGAIAIDGGELLVSESTLAWNAGKVGGAVFVGGDARVQIVATIFDNNLSLKGGAIGVRDGAEVDVWTCRFEQNRADDEGHHLWAISSFDRHPHILVSNSILGPSSGNFGCAIANHPVFSAQLALDNTAVSRDFNASVLLGSAPATPAVGEYRGLGTSFLGRSVTTPPSWSPEANRLRILETARLRLRPMSESHALGLYELNLNPRVRRFLGEPPLVDVAEAREVIETVIRPQYEMFGVGRMAIERRPDGAFVGWCGLKYRVECAEYDLGFRLFEAYWGLGLATEASRAVLDDAIVRLEGARLIGETHVDNRGSRRVLEKVGFVFERRYESAIGPTARFVWA